RRAWTAPSTSTFGALSPPIASTAMRITLRRPRVPGADHTCSCRTSGRDAADASGLHTVGTAGARWARPCNVCGARASCAWRVFASVPPWDRPRLSVAELALQGHEPVPALVDGWRAATGARVQVLATPRAQPAAIITAHYPLRDGEQQLLSDRGAQIDLGRIGRQGIRARVLQRVRITGK